MPDRQKSPLLAWILVVFLGVAVIALLFMLLTDSEEPSTTTESASETEAVSDPISPSFDDTDIAEEDENPDEESSDDEEEEVDEEKRTDDESEEVDTSDAPSASGDYNFDVHSADGWEHTSRAESSIQELTEGQKIIYTIVEDPTQEDIVYFAAATINEADDTSFVGVYSYNTDDYSWERIWKNEYATGGSSFLNDNALPQLSVVGYENGKIVMVIQDANFYSGACSDILLLGIDQTLHGESHNLISIELEEPYGSIEEYIAPSQAIAAANERKNNCPF